MYIKNHFCRYLFYISIEKRRCPMILEYRVNETHVQAAWLKTLYDLIEELDCKCKTYIDESYNYTYRHFSRMRIMERYLHFISIHDKDDEILSELKEAE